MSDSTNPLDGVEAYVFDVFGTVVDWYGSLTRALEFEGGAEDPGALKNEDEIDGFFPRSDWLLLMNNLSMLTQTGEASRRGGASDMGNMHRSPGLGDVWADPGPVHGVMAM